MVINVDKNTIPCIEASNDTDMDVFLDTICASADCYDESAIQEIKNSVISVADLWKQWSKYTKQFVNHKWIYRYINEDQKTNLQKHYEVLCNEKTNYSSYKKSFAAICKFVGLSVDDIILENVIFKKDSIDKDQEIIAVGYSKGKVKVRIPEGIRLIHARTSDDGVEIKELKPSFRSRVVGKYMYPTKRCYFTCIKTIPDNKADFHGKVNKYTPKDRIEYAYIDPACSDFKYNAVYVETETPIPVENFTSFIKRIFNKENSKEG